MATVGTDKEYNRIAYGLGRNNVSGQLVETYFAGGEAGREVVYSHDLIDWTTLILDTDSSTSSGDSSIVGIITDNDENGYDPSGHQPNFYFVGRQFWFGGAVIAQPEMNQYWVSHDDTATFFNLVYENNVCYALGNQVIYSTNLGNIWLDEKMTINGQNGAWTDACYNKNTSRWVAVGRANTSAFSDDNGLTWSGTTIYPDHFDSSSIPTGVTFVNPMMMAVATDGEKYVAVGNMMLVSDDGINWKIPNSFPYVLPIPLFNDVVWDGYHFVACGINNWITYSTDGYDWVEPFNALDENGETPPSGTAWNSIMVVPRKSSFTISCKPNLIYFYKEGETKEVEVIVTGPNNPSYTIVSTPSWISATKTSDSILTLTSDPNTTDSNITGQVILAHESEPSIQVTLTVISRTTSMHPVIVSSTNSIFDVDLPYTCSDGETVTGSFTWDGKPRIYFNHPVKGASIGNTGSAGHIGSGYITNGYDYIIVNVSDFLEYVDTKMYVNNISFTDINETINLELTPEWPSFPRINIFGCSWETIAFGAPVSISPYNGVMVYNLATQLYLIDFTRARVGDTIQFFFENPGTTLDNFSFLGKEEEFFYYDNVLAGSRRVIKCSIAKTNSNLLTATITELSLGGSNPGVFNVNLSGVIEMGWAKVSIRILAHIYG